MMLGYKKKRLSDFMKVAIKKNNEKEQDKKPYVSNFKEKKIKQRALQEKKRCPCYYLFYYQLSLYQ